MGPQSGHGTSGHYVLQPRRRADHLRPAEPARPADERPPVSVRPHWLGQERHAQQHPEPGDCHLPAAPVHRGGRQQLRPVRRLRHAVGPQGASREARARRRGQPRAVRGCAPAGRYAQPGADAGRRCAGRGRGARGAGSESQRGSGRAARRARRAGDHRAVDDHRRRRQGRSAHDARRSQPDPAVHPRCGPALRDRAAHRTHARRARRAARARPGLIAARDAPRAPAGDGGRDGYVLPGRRRRDVRSARHALARGRHHHRGPRHVRARGLQRAALDRVHQSHQHGEQHRRARPVPGSADHQRDGRRPHHHQEPAARALRREDHEDVAQARRLVLAGNAEHRRPAQSGRAHAQHDRVVDLPLDATGRGGEDRALPRAEPGAEGPDAVGPQGGGQVHRGRHPLQEHGSAVPCGSAQPVPGAGSDRAGREGGTLSVDAAVRHRRAGCGLQDRREDRPRSRHRIAGA
mmetsp:Transcript_21056/g.81516  ORF Transcript_21056/g.81516 Transcript_21056/m.81516 type:complete len:463 (+) Transcript_21056:1825-3213(+)